MKNLPLMLKTIGLVVLLGVFVSVGHAQNREQFGISAKAGGVNSVSGQVLVKRAGQASEQILNANDDVSSGDIISTRMWARAEILLNPGSYLRLGENSQAELVDSSLDNLRVKLNKGSAIVEAIGGENTELRINIVTGQQPLVIVRRGLYRINAQAGITELLVQKGQAQLSNNPSELAKGGKKIVLNGGSSLIVKIGKYNKDEFDNWSKERGQTLAQANLRLSARTMSGYSALNSWGSGSYGFGLMGLWAYNRSYRCYTFLPSYVGFSSVYGYYESSFDPWYSIPGIPGGNCCRDRITVTRAPAINNPGWSGGSSGGSGGSGSSGGSGGSGGQGGSGGSSPVTPSAPSAPSQAGPRDPDSGGRSINRIRDPK